MGSEQKVSASASARWPWIDALRGVAIAGMAIYHFVWDLYFFHYVPPETLRSPGFVLFGHSIACSFLGLAGFAMALAHQKGPNARSFLLRLGKIAAAALLVTVATYIAFPQTYVSFGILHCIAAASALSWLLLGRFWAFSLAAGALIFGLGSLVENASFDAVNGWLGLGQRIPLTNDWRPIFPWAGAMLIGLAFGQLTLKRGWSGQEAALRAPRALQFAGRHSLSIYLLHQPLLFALVWAAAQFVPASTPPRIEPFVQACIRNCLDKSSAAFCGKACPCIAQRAQAAGVWGQLVSGGLSGESQEKYNSIIGLCQKEALH